MGHRLYTQQERTENIRYRLQQKAQIESGIITNLQQIDWERITDRYEEKSFEEFVNVVTADAYEIIRSYYGSDTADVIVSSYSEQAVDAFIAAHPDLFSKANPFNSQGGLLEGYFENWYHANWENTAETISDEEAEESVMDIGY